MMIKEFGGNLAKIWDELRPVTQKMVEGARLAGRSTHGATSSRTTYDAHADWEVSRLLTALDESSENEDVRQDTIKLAELNELADTCVRILESQSASAEIFIQLASRAIKASDYVWLDRLADQLAERYSAAEVAEVIRQTELPQLRAIAYETLATMPVGMVVPLIDDMLYSGIAAAAIEAMAYEFNDDEARDILDQLEFVG
jgi:hypothetical protein